MNKVYLHYKEQKNWYLKTLCAIFICFVLWGIYKNGFVYFFQGKMDFFSALKPILFILLGIISIIFSDFIEHKKIVINDKSVFEGVLLGIMMPPRMSIIAFSLLLLGYSFLRLFFKNGNIPVSRVLFFKVVSIIIACIFFQLDYQNSVEFTNPYLYGIIDTFFGRSVGGIGTTSIFLLLIFFLVKTNDFYFKKELPFYIVSSYTLIIMFYVLFFTKDNLLLSILNSHVYFMAIVLSPISGTYPAENKYLIPFGIIVGIFCFLSQMIFHFTDGIYISLFVVQVSWYCFFYLKYKRKR